MMQKKNPGTVWIRLLLCTIIIGAGVGGFILLKNMKTPPVQTPAVERAIAVEAAAVEMVDFPISLDGYGLVQSPTVSTLAAEVAGKVLNVHPRLDTGELIGAGEILLSLDDRDYRVEFEAAEERLITLRREMGLAEKEYKRLKSLYETSNTGTLSGVEGAERAVNSIRERIVQAEQARQTAELKLERSVIRAPFPCRIREVMIEQHEYVMPGQKLLTISDDRVLEAIVALDSRDVVRWLDFDGRENERPANWFPGLAEQKCTIAWTEDETIRAAGQVDRIVRFDPQTRTLEVAVRLERQQNERVPVVDGMFCRIIIPGRILENVAVLPRHAVSFANTVYVVNNNRLQTRPVKVLRFEEDRAVIGDGLQAGEIVVTTRLENPLENALLSVTLQERGRK